MGQAIAFDTHAYVKKLKAVGFTEEQAEVQAEALAELIDERLATKQGLKELDNAHKHDIMLLKHDMKEMEAGLKRDIAEVKRDIKEMETRLTIKLGAIATTGIIIVAALVKLL
ncbi:MAG: DUF1640 domain-containing protein [Nanoarchaeota archaeon]|nr:DUF1640 domain-containing protein [Nanoarchaeota archaeon]